MDQDNELTHIDDADLSYLEGELAKTKAPVKIEELVTLAAFKKTASLRRLEAKEYNPDCVYEVGDLVHKEYDEPLTVSAKGAEHFKGSVVLKVVNKFALPDFNCEMLEVDYTGGGIFRKHVDYMKKSSTQVLLPSNCDGKAKSPEILKKADDPRMNELPLTDKDLKKLERNLKAALQKSDRFFNWNEFWQLEDNRIPIKDKDVGGIENFFSSTRQSKTTEDLVKQSFGIDKSGDLFDIYCLSLNYILDKNYKKKFVYIAPGGWGKWFSREILDSFLTNLPMTKAKARLPLLDETKHESLSSPPELPLKVYLSWREVLSGCIKIPKTMNRHFSHSREYVFTDSDTGDKFVVYYFPSSNLFCGLSEFYEKHNVPQGASLTIEKKTETSCQFSLKKSKKKLEVPRLAYDPVKDEIKTTGEETFTFALPNKIIFLDGETLGTLLMMYKQRKNTDLKDLIILMFKNFGLEGNALTIHYQRAYHLVDCIKRTTLEDVETVLLNSPEFMQSEKRKGLFSYQLDLESSEETGQEEIAEKPPDAKIAAMVEELEEEILPEIGTVGEIVTPEGAEVIEVVEPQKPVQPEPKAKKEKIKKPPAVKPGVAPEAKRPPRRKKDIEAAPRPEKSPLEAAKKERPGKKKKDRIKEEQERKPRRRRGEKRFIEERIELEESEYEALIARKAEEKELEPFVMKEKPAKEAAEDTPEAEKKEDIKEYVSASPISSLFADKLKSALDKTPVKTPDKSKKSRKRRK